jgi:hypothetical protein
MGLAKPGNTCGLMDTSLDLAHIDAAGKVFGWFWNRNEPVFRSEPLPLTGHPHAFVTLQSPCDCNPIIDYQEQKKEKESQLVTAAPDCSQVMANLYSQLATRLKSLAIILPIHLFTITRVHVCHHIP